MTSASRYAAVLCLAMGACASAAAAETTRYVVLVDGGKHAGHQVVTRDDDGSTRVDFRFKDNGRGPELQERYTLAPDGTYLTYAVQGTSTYGAPVQETFRRDGDHVQWKTTSDEGAMAVDGTQLYVPLGGTPASFAVAMGALAREDDGALSLLPHGTLRMRDIATVEIRRGGEPRTVQLVALTGLGLTPAFAWATTGASPRLFAYIIPGYLQLIEEGWEQSAGALETRQKRAEDEDLAALQAALAHPLEGALLINNARVFDSERAVLGPVSDVLVSGGRIVEVVPDPGQGAADRSPSRAGRDAAAVIEAEGRALLPGLFDSHAHIGPWEGGLHLAAGVTTVRDMGNDNATLQRLMQQGESKQLMLPRVVPAGFIEGESEFSARNGFVVATLDEAKRAVDWYAANGYPQVKIYNSFPREILPATIARVALQSADREDAQQQVSAVQGDEVANEAQLQHALPVVRHGASSAMARSSASRPYRSAVLPRTSASISGRRPGRVAMASAAAWRTDQSPSESNVDNRSRSARVACAWSAPSAARRTPGSSSASQGNSRSRSRGSHRSASTPSAAMVSARGAPSPSVSRAQPAIANGFPNASIPSSRSRAPGRRGSDRRSSSGPVSDPGPACRHSIATRAGAQSRRFAASGATSAMARAGSTATRTSAAASDWIGLGSCSNVATASQCAGSARCLRQASPSSCIEPLRWSSSPTAACWSPNRRSNRFRRSCAAPRRRYCIWHHAIRNQAWSARAGAVHACASAPSTASSRLAPASRGSQRCSNAARRCRRRAASSDSSSTCSIRSAETAARPIAISTAQRSQASSGSASRPTPQNSRRSPSCIQVRS